MKKNSLYQKFFIVISLFLCFFMATVSCKAEGKKKVIRVGCATTTGYHQKKNGSVTGYGYSYESLLAQYAGWKIEYVEGTWPKLQDQLERGEIDLLGFLVENQERRTKYDFSKLPAGHSMSCLVAKKKSKKYSYQDYEAFDGMTVGCIRSNANIQAFLDYAKRSFM